MWLLAGNTPRSTGDVRSFQQQREQPRQRRRRRCGVFMGLSIIVVGLVVLLVVLVLVLYLKQASLLGDGPTLQGGILGRKMDNTHKRWLFYLREYQYRQSFSQQMGYPVPSCCGDDNEEESKHANQQGVPVLLSTYYTETLLQTQQRQQKQQQQHISKGCPRCIFWSLAWGDVPHINNIHNNNNHQASATEEQEQEWNVISYLETEMDLWMIQHQSLAVMEIYQLLNLNHRIQLWGLAMIQEYGGGTFVFVDDHNNNNNNKATWTNHHFSLPPPATVNNNNQHELLLLEPPTNNNNNNNRDPSTTISFAFARNAKQATLNCFFQRLGQSQEEETMSSSYSWIGILKSLRTIHETCEDPTTDHVRQQQQQCCQTVQLTFHDAEMNNLQQNQQQQQQQQRNQNKILQEGEPTTTRMVSVVVEEESTTSTPKNNTVPKVPHSYQMEQSGCTPGWLCNRCLRLPWRGSLSTCANVCHACYIQHMTKTTVALQPVEIHVHVKHDMRSHDHNTHTRIPRIIHQTWFETLTVDNYPHLTRLANSWNASGWEYRFYTDQTARQYVARNFPFRFVRAYDALLPGAFKADFFRLLVLLKDGGVYADMDVQLHGTALERFVLPRSTNDVSFFVPRDVPIDRWPNSNYCLWNGLMGAAPGHPIVVQAAQDLLNHIDNRWDYYDVEHALCQESSHGDCEIWKLRSIPILLLTGPCALGISVNTALKKPNKLQGFDLGWIHSNNNDSDNSHNNMGNALILLADRYDHGELRFTDVEQNLLVASTNANKLITFPLKMTTTTTAGRSSSVHYSKSETDIMGSSGTYVDNQVTNEWVQLTIIHHTHQEEDG